MKYLACKRRATISDNAKSERKEGHGKPRGVRLKLWMTSEGKKTLRMVLG
jgi:hypothetical protein